MSASSVHVKRSILETRLKWEVVYVQGLGQGSSATIGPTPGSIGMKRRRPITQRWSICRVFSLTAMSCSNWVRILTMRLMVSSDSWSVSFNCRIVLYNSCTSHSNLHTKKHTQSTRFSFQTLHCVKRKFRYADFFETFPWRVLRWSFWEVGDKSSTRSHGSCYGEVTGGLVVSNHRDMSRWFDKFPWQVGNQPVCVAETRKSATSATRHGEVGDVRDKTRGSRRRRGQINGDVTGLSRTSRGSRHSGIWALQRQNSACWGVGGVLISFT